MTPLKSLRLRCQYGARDWRAVLFLAPGDDLAAEVVGYSRLMGRDEVGTVTRLRRPRVERLQPILSRPSGRMVKLTETAR